MMKPTKSDIEFEGTEMNMKWKEMINFLHKKASDAVDREGVNEAST